MLYNLNITRKVVEIGEDISSSFKITLNDGNHRSNLSQSCVLQKMFSEKFCNIDKKAPVLESLFNKVTGLKVRNLIKKRLQHGCFPVNISKFLGTTFL